jgi:hypothetical protein
MCATTDQLIAGSVFKEAMAASTQPPQRLRAVKAKVAEGPSKARLRRKAVE